jgi:hypothetical protein
MDWKRRKTSERERREKGQCNGSYDVFNNKWAFNEIMSSTLGVEIRRLWYVQLQREAYYLQCQDAITLLSYFFMTATSDNL